MKNFVRILSVVFFSSLAIIGCGGGGDEPVVPVPQPVPVVEKVADVTFTNVTTNPLVTSVMPGQRAVEVAAFRIAWKNQMRYPVGQLVFKNQYTGSVSQTFKKFQLVDNAGNDMTNEAAYFVRVDDVKQEVAIDFYGYPWNVFESQTSVPKTYSLLASIDPLAKDGQQFAFSLVAVQMHDTGIDVLSEVVGGDFMVMKVAGMGLPIVHSNSPSYVNVANTSPGSVFSLGGFVVSCPKDNVYACVFTGIDYRSYGVVVPYFTVNGATVTSSIDSQPDGSYHASMYYLIPPGDSVMFTMNASTPDLAPELTFSIYIMDLFFEIGNTKVSPVIPTGPDVCRLIVGDDRNCKG